MVPAQIIIGFALSNEGGMVLGERTTHLLLLLDEDWNVVLLHLLSILEELVGRVNVASLLILRLHFELLNMLVWTLIHLHNMVVSNVVDIVAYVIVNYSDVEPRPFHTLLFELILSTVLASFIKCYR